LIIKEKGEKEIYLAFLMPALSSSPPALLYTCRSIRNFESSTKNIETIP
jgi:hypothetical protein